MVNRRDQFVQVNVTRLARSPRHPRGLRFSADPREIDRNAYQQATFARTHVIALPAGTPNTPLGAVEIKAAWKVLTDAEGQSGRFHTLQALLGGSKTPVTVGLVGFHAFIVSGSQGAWATFSQVDNAPAERPATSGIASTSSIRTARCPAPTSLSNQRQGCQSGPGGADRARRQSSGCSQHLHALHPAAV